MFSPVISHHFNDVSDMTKIGPLPNLQQHDILDSPITSIIGNNENAWATAIGNMSRSCFKLPSI